MGKESRRIALSGMMVALGATIMLLVGVIPLATFIAPALAGLTLLPVLHEFGRKWALAAWAAIAALSLMLAPDKEAALLFTFLGWYPVGKVDIDRIRSVPLRTLIKLLCFNVAAGAMLAGTYWLFGMQGIAQEYAGMGRAMLVAFILLANFTMLMYDVLLVIMMNLYRVRLRPKILH